MLGIALRLIVIDPYLIMLVFLILFITKSEYYPSYTITIIPCTLFYYDLKPLFSTHPKMGIRNFTKWGKVCNVADLPQGMICNERRKICNVANLLPLG